MYSKGRSEGAESDDIREENVLTSRDPITGPMAGASIAPEFAIATIPPLSLGLAMSATEPCDSAIMLADPVACTHRKTMSSQ